MRELACLAALLAPSPFRWRCIAPDLRAQPGLLPEVGSFPPGVIPVEESEDSAEKAAFGNGFLALVLPGPGSQRCGERVFLPGLLQRLQARGRSRRRVKQAREPSPLFRKPTLLIARLLLRNLYEPGV